MNKNTHLEELLKEDFNHWVYELGTDDERWREVMQRKPELFDEFTDEPTPQNIFRYLRERYNRVHGKALREEATRLKAEGDAVNHRLMFNVLLNKRLKQYKEQPYNGMLNVGHFVGIKNNSEEDGNGKHTIGYIRDYFVENGKIARFVLDKEDGNTLIVPVENTYRIY